MNAPIMKKGDEKYFKTLKEIEQFSEENGNPLSGFKVETKKVDALVVTKL